MRCWICTITWNTPSGPATATQPPGQIERLPSLALEARLAARRRVGSPACQSKKNGSLSATVLVSLRSGASYDCLGKSRAIAHHSSFGLETTPDTFDRPRHL